MMTAFADVRICRDIVIISPRPLSYFVGIFSFFPALGVDILFAGFRQKKVTWLLSGRLASTPASRSWSTMALEMPACCWNSSTEM